MRGAASLRGDSSPPHPPRARAHARARRLPPLPRLHRCRHHDLPGADHLRQHLPLSLDRPERADLPGHQARWLPAAPCGRDHPALREEGLQAGGAEAGAETSFMAVTRWRVPAARLPSGSVQMSCSAGKTAPIDGCTSSWPCDSFLRGTTGKKGHCLCT
ncbi:nucleoside diphosphate kinase 3 isoform X2 [Phascolarctos cinereus]|uniref:Nucleoside diphosphate kinase 3 isoform X2 n=1 Tax=Phascolarctos cinereus TaxID=38626 RepID=A0A6P5LUR7_PHACI|nr:nucleoside diphosphate kinase 3 isoform X2 [Phascolarctos cinereus]